MCVYKSKMIRALLRGCAVLLAIGGSIFPAAADCTWKSADFRKGTLEFAHLYTLLAWSDSKRGYLNMSTVDKSAAQFAISMGAASGSDVLIHCTGAELLRFYPASGSPNTPTSAPGIIYRFPLYSGSCAGCLFYGTGNMAIPASGDITADFLTNNMRVGMQFAQSPYLLTYVNGVVERQYVGTLRTSDGVEVLDIFVGEWTFTVTPCEVSGYDREVFIGEHSLSDFKGLGSSLDVATVNLNLACVTGMTPRITFSGTVASEDHPTVLANHGDAKGIGLTLSYLPTRTPVTFGVPVGLGTTTHSSFSDYNFSAALYQTASSVSGGSLDFSTTFIIEFE